MIALSVSEISALGGFCDEQDEEELGILVVGLTKHLKMGRHCLKEEANKFWT